MDPTTRRFQSLVMGTAIACVIVATHGRTSAAPLQVGGGYDYSVGPADQVTRSAMALGSMGLGVAGHVTLAGLHYDDNHNGQGYGFVGGLGLPMPSLGTLQLWGTRFVGDDGFRGWRLKAGPRLDVPAGSSLGLYYVHDENNADANANGGIAELSVPMVPGLTGRANAALAWAPGAPGAAQAGLGVNWAPARWVLLTGDVGLAQNGALVTSSSPARRPLPLPLVGGGSDGSSSTMDSKLEPIGQVGVRLVFP